MKFRLGSFVIGFDRRDDLEDIAERAVEFIRQKQADQLSKELRQLRSVTQLADDVERLKREKARLSEHHERKNREIEHKVGLAAKRQEFETEAAVREAKLEVREENLKADQERFKAEMDFQRERLEAEVASTRKLVEKLLKRLPSAEIFATASLKGDD